MDDNRIIELFFARDESAIEQTAKRYGEYCRAAVKRILDSDEDAEEVLNDTYLRAWKSIPPERPEHLRLYLAKIARNLALNRLKERSAERRGGKNTVFLCLDELAQVLPSPERIEDEQEERELIASINRFLRTVPERDASIFINRYFHTEPTDIIARRYGLSQANVQKILLRTRNKLKAHLINEGYEI